METSRPFSFVEGAQPGTWLRQRIRRRSSSSPTVAELQYVAPPLQLDGVIRGMLAPHFVDPGEDENETPHSSIAANHAFVGTRTDNSNDTGQLELTMLEAL